MLSRFTATLVVDHDLELSKEKIADAILTTLPGTSVLYERKPTTTDKQVRNQTIDPTSLCFGAVLDAVEDLQEASCPERT